MCVQVRERTRVKVQKVEECGNHVDLCGETRRWHYQGQVDRTDYGGCLHSQEFMWSGAIAKCRKQGNDGSDVVTFSKSPTLPFTTAREI